MANGNLDRQTRFVEQSLLKNPDIHPLLGNTHGDLEALLDVLKAMEYELDEENVSRCVAKLELFIWGLQLPSISLTVLKQIVKENRVDYIERY